MIKSDLVPASVIAERWGVSLQTVNHWVRQGRIPCLRPTRKVIRFDVDAVDAALQQPMRKAVARGK